MDNIKGLRSIENRLFIRDPFAAAGSASLGAPDGTPFLGSKEGLVRVMVPTTAVNQAMRVLHRMTSVKRNPLTAPEEGQKTIAACGNAVPPASATPSLQLSSQDMSWDMLKFLWCAPWGI